jgi:DNA modification methylase
MDMSIKELRIPSYQIKHGNNLDLIKSIPDSSVDSIVTDPPYEIGFMLGSVNWDNTGQAYNLELWRECLRVLKPGGI